MWRLLWFYYLHFLRNLRLLELLKCEFSRILKVADMTTKVVFALTRAAENSWQIYISIMLRLWRYWKGDKTLFGKRSPGFLLNSTNESVEFPGFLIKPRSFQLQIGTVKFCLWIRPQALLKGSVSGKLRPMLLYIIRKLFIKPLSAYHFHKVLLKGYAAIYV